MAKVVRYIYGGHPVEIEFETRKTVDKVLKDFCTERGLESAILDSRTKAETSIVGGIPVTRIVVVLSDAR